LFPTRSRIKFQSQYNSLINNVLQITFIRLSPWLAFCFVFKSMKSISFRAVKNSNGGYVRSTFVGKASERHAESRGVSIALGLFAVAVAAACFLLLTK
jgi:hypothetical protein